MAGSISGPVVPLSEERFDLKLEWFWLGIRAHIFVKGLYLSPSSAAVIRNGSKT